MTNSNHFETIESEVTRLKKNEIEQIRKIDSLVHEHQKDMDSFCTELLSVVDAFNKADARLVEIYPDSEKVERARNRFATSKRKLVDILTRFQVKEIEFPDGLATPEDCQIIDTIPDQEKENNTIVSIEKPGYRRDGRLLRVAEVIVVRN